jgi:hypothetical protein
MQSRAPLKIPIAGFVRQKSSGYLASCAWLKGVQIQLVRKNQSVLETAHCLRDVLKLIADPKSGGRY